MLSMKLFEEIEYVYRKFLDNSIVFGGIQVIAVGDFFRLPPMSQTILKTIRVTTVLNLKLLPKFFATSLFLQMFYANISLISLRKLRIYQEIHMIFCLDLVVPYHQVQSLFRLSARNFDCFMYNAMKLIDLDGDEIIYNSVDEGDVSKLEKLSVPKKIHLKIGCPVMLLKNLSVKLVNGLRGTVIRIANNNVTVNFLGGSNSESLITDLRPESFLLYSCSDGKVVASRQQYPPVLGIQHHYPQIPRFDLAKSGSGCQQYFCSRSTWRCNW